VSTGWKRRSLATTARDLRPGRREELVEVPARLFRDRAYEATTMQDIADAFGILKGSLTHYVKSKDDLLWLIVRGVLRALLPAHDRDHR
jgi:AcrR family transcriptional regulator